MLCGPPTLTRDIGRPRYILTAMSTGLSRKGSGLLESITTSVFTGLGSAILRWGAGALPSMMEVRVKEVMR